MPALARRTRGSGAARFVLAVLAIHNFHYTLGKDVSVNKDCLKRNNQDGGPFNSLHSLRHVKQRWHNTTLELEEEYNGKFPKLIGGVLHDASQDASVKYSIHGPGVDESPEIRFDVRRRTTGEILDNSLFLTIQIKDRNDNAPEFLEKELNINMKENHNKNEPVHKITAIDMDQEGTANSEVADRTFRLLIRASDRGSPSLSSTATINIAVEDSNNNLPVFTQENYHADVPEGRTKNDILRLKVEDKDSPNTPAWRAKYTIKAGNERGNFAIVTDPKTNEGVLSVVQPLVYGRPSVRRLVIVVENEESFFFCERGLVSITAPPRLSEVSVSINVTDQNDAPQFNPPILILHHQEGMVPGTRLVQYVAQDPDTAQHRIRYKIVSDPDGWVTITENSAIVTTAKTLHRESPFMNNSIYTIVIHATDDGIPPLTSTGTILLHLSDVNDNAPILVKPSLMICEEKGKGPFRIQAEDKDTYPYAEPFTFQLEEALEGTENLWSLGESSDNSVDIFMLKSLPPGNYSVPLRILDMQGFSKQQSLHVKVCSCLDRIRCEADPEMEAVSMRLGWGLSGGIMAIFIFLILGLGLLRWYFCISTVEKDPAFIPYGETNQSLIHYHEESKPVLPKGPPDWENRTTPFSRYEKFLTGKLQVLEEFFIQKRNDITNLEDNMVSYMPHIYAEEGLLEKSKSLLSLPIPEDDKNSLPDNFLDTLGSTFVPLGKICSR